MPYFCHILISELIIHNLTHATKRDINSVKNNPLIMLMVTFIMAMN